MSQEPADDGIPLLTDVVTPAEAAIAVTASAPAAAASVSAASLQNTRQLYQLVQPGWSAPGANAQSAADGILIEELNAGAVTGGGGDEVWLEELTHRVQSRVLAGLTARIDPLVEQRLRESLTDLLEQVLAGMTAELKVTARNIVRDAVAQAVAAELAQLHSAKQS